jgi:hypothetical protein
MIVIIISFSLFFSSSDLFSFNRNAAPIGYVCRHTNSFRNCFAAFYLTSFIFNHSISWEYSQANTISIDQYEDNRPPRRSHFEMILPRTVRQDMLRKEWDVTQTQIANAVRNNIKIKNQRRATVGNLGKASKFEELLEKTQRGLKRGIFFQKSTSQQAADLRKQLEDMERMRAEVYGAADEDKDEEEYGTEDNPIDYDGPQVEEAPGSPVSVADSDVSETREHNSLSKPTMTVRVVSNIAETVGAPKSRFTTEDMTPDTDPEGLDHSDVDASF